MGSVIILSMIVVLAGLTFSAVEAEIAAEHCRKAASVIRG